MGAVVMAAIGNVDPAAVPKFATLGDTIAAWCLLNLNCLPGTMASSGSTVSGSGLFLALPDSSSAIAGLGSQLATAMGDPSANGVATWTKFAGAFVSHIQTFGTINPASFVAPTPGPGPLTGNGTVQFSSLVFAPLLSSQLGVAEPVAAAMLEVFGAQILTHIQSNAMILATAVAVPFVPLTSPVGGGPISGSGSLA